VDTAVNTAISKIRQALRDSSDAPRYVETVTGKGYRFIASVTAADLVSGGDSETRAGQPVAVPANVLPTAAPTLPSPPAVVAVPLDRRRRLAWSVALPAAALVVVVTSIALAVVGRRARTISVAVVPFENLSPDPAREYLADGLAEETSNALAHIDPDRVRVP
jgi:hypothetical protein